MTIKKTKTDNKFVWLVWLFTGEYGDYHETVIGAFSSEKLANKFLQSKEKELDVIGLNQNGDNSKCNSEPYSYYAAHGVDFGGAAIAISGPIKIDDPKLVDKN